jgi:DNA repair protein RecN (Recombination protein N)
MLIRLKLENIALVDRAELLLDSGMSVLTGETGAGKSVIVTAINLALGERADREMIRHGTDSAVVEATFQISSLPPRYRKEYAEYLTNDCLTVVREISRDGYSKVKINGTTATLNRLKELTAPIAEIIGQHANQMLMNEDNHLTFLDYFAGVEPAREEVSELYSAWEQVNSQLKKLKSRRDELMRDRELLLFQRDEIESAQVRPGEEAEIIAEQRRLNAARELMTSASTIIDLMDNEHTSVLSMFREARKELEKMSRVDETLESRLTDLTEIDFQIEEFRRCIEQYGARIVDDPSRLDEINARLEELYALKRKYGESEEAILSSLKGIKVRLEKSPDTEIEIKRLEQEYEQLKAEYTAKAIALSDTRRKAAQYLSKVVQKELAELAIDSGGFEFEFLYEEHQKGVILDGRSVKPFAHGLEKGRFLFSANPGEPLKSLVKTASGGEISRVLLALKAAEKKNKNLLHSLLVFDEVDAGIGGATAVEVAQKLKKLSEDNQVIVVTHLHQIARVADHHYLAEKNREQGSRFTISVGRLNLAGKESELERMVALPEEA